MATINISADIRSGNVTQSQNVEQGDTVIVSLTINYGIQLQSSSNCSGSHSGGGGSNVVATITITNFTGTGTYSIVYYQAYQGRTYTLSGSVSVPVTITAPVISAVTSNNPYSANVTTTVTTSSNGSGGTLKFAKTTTNSVPSSGWQTSNQFASGHPRNSTRYYWASQDEDTAGAFDGGEALTVGYKTPGTTLYVNDFDIDFDATSATVSVGSTTTGAQYKLFVSGSPTSASNIITAPAGSSTDIPVFSSVLPTEGNTEAYRVFVRLPLALGGDNLFDSSVGSTGEVEITRLSELDDEPDNFDFVDVNDAQPGTLHTQAVQITGIDTAITVSRITGTATFQITNSSVTPSTFNGNAKTATNSQWMHIRQSAPSAYNNTIYTVWNVGGIVANFAHNTVVEDTTPTQFYFTDLADVATGSDQRTTRQITGINNTITATRASGNGGFAVTSSATAPTSSSSYTSTSKSVDNEDYIHVRQVASSTAFKCLATTISAGGVSDRFAVTTAPTGTTDRIASLGIYIYSLEGNATTTQTQDVSDGDTFKVTMDGAIGSSANFDILDNVYGVFTLTNCTANTTSNVLMREQTGSGSAVNGITLTVNGSAGATYSMVAVFTHLNSSGVSKTKTFTLTGTIDPPAYGMECFDVSGNKRLDISKRQPRLVARYTGTGNGSSFNLNTAGYGSGGLSQWHAVNVKTDSNYYVGTSGTNYIRMERADVRTENSSYQIFSGDEDYDVLVFRF